VELNHKERLFVSYYLANNGNATDAAVKAGYGSTRGSSETLGLRLLGKVRIRAAIAAKVAHVAMAADEVLARMADIASASLGDFLDVEGENYRVNLSKGKRLGRLHTLKKIKTKVRTITIKDTIETEVETDIEVKEAYPALVKLGEYHGLWDREQVKGLTMEAVAEMESLDARLDGGDPEPPSEAAGQVP
jgi:hypothetical protein